VEAHKLASIAGTVTMVVFGALHYAEPLVMVQQTTPQPAPGRSELPPARSEVPVTNQPPAPTTLPPTTTTQPTNIATGPFTPLTTERLFMLQNPTTEARMGDFTAQITRMETQLNDTNLRLLRQLGQARQLQGDRRSEAFAEVLQGILQNNAATMQYVMQLRNAMTGPLATPGTPTPANPTIYPTTTYPNGSYPAPAREYPNGNPYPPPAYNPMMPR
jgi:hypothetical protein